MKNTLLIISVILLFSFSSFCQAPTITSFTPEEAGEGTEVTIIGTNLLTTTSVSFGGVAAAINIQSNTTVIATVGAGASGDVELTNISGTTTKSGFTFIPPPQVSLLLPQEARKGDTVRIRGMNLLNPTAVSFGGVPATYFEGVDQNEVRAVVGEGASGDVEVTTPGGSGSESNFFFDDDPLITSFEPTSGVLGDTIVINGDAFTGAYEVDFGYYSADFFEVSGDTLIRAVIGGITSPDVAIGVRTTKGYHQLSGFTFAHAPVIDSFEPDSAGEDMYVFITGRNFTANSESVSFGGVEAPAFEVLYDTLIRAIVPFAESGNIEVKSYQHGTASLAGFTFLPPPSITSFTPAEGRLGTVITITGEDFDFVTEVTVGGGEPIDFTIDSPTQITAILTDAGTNRDIVLKSPYGDTFKATFDLLAGPLVESFEPSTGAVGTEVTITGSGFSTTPSANIVRFGKVRAEVTSASDTELVVKVPEGASYEAITVTTDNLIAASRLPFGVTFSGEDISAESFSEAFTIATSPDYGVAVADMNGDGKPDLILKNTTSIMLMLNETEGGALNFGEPMPLPATGYFYNVFVEDLNGDGKPDVIVNSNTLQVLENTTENGIPSFDDPKLIRGQYIANAELADFDHDGRKDIAWSWNDGMVCMRNTSTPDTIRFEEIEIFAIGQQVDGLKSGDLNGDDFMDLVVISKTGDNARIMMNTSIPGDISFALAITLTTNKDPHGLVIADLDGNERPEVTIVYNDGSEYSVFWNGGDNGTFAFSPKEDFDTRPYNFYGNTTDFNGDGKPDLLFYNYNSNFLIYQNNTENENLSFGNEVLIPASYIGTTVLTDIDLNGKPDIVTGTSTSVVIFRNQMNEPVLTSFSPKRAGHGSTVTIMGTGLESASSVTFGGTPAESFTILSSTEIQAVVGEGASGIVSVATSEGVAGLTGYTYFDGPIIESFTPLTAATGSEVTVSGRQFSADESGNVVRFGSTLAEVTSATETEIVVTVPAGATYESISVTTHGLASYSDSPFLPGFNGGFNLTSSLLAAPIDFEAGEFTRGLAIGDMDDDGKADVVVSSAGANSIAVLRNTSSDATISLAARQEFVTGTTPEGIVVADINNDGKLDVIAANSSDNTLSVLTNQSSEGSISFSSKIDFATPTNPQSLVAADFNDDGKIDIATVGFTNSGEIGVLINTSSAGNIAFNEFETFSVESFPTALTTGDYNNDGLPDLAVAGLNKLDVLYNTSVDGKITFLSSTIISTGAFVPSLLSGDIDLRGSTDLVLVKDDASIPDLFFNVLTTPGVFSQSPFGTIASASGKAALGDVNGDGLPDLVQALSDNRVGLSNKRSIFTNSVTFATSVKPFMVAIADIDGDGKNDVVTVNETDGSVSVMKNTAPSITSISPTSASRGETVTITGVSFDNATEVKFGSVEAESFQVVSSTTVTAVVGEAESGEISVVMNNEPLKFQGFEYVPTPEIESLGQTSGNEGDEIYIYGFDFIDVTSVSFGETPAASFEVITRNTIVAVLGEGSTGDVTVVTDHGEAVFSGFTHNDDVVGVEAGISAERECTVFPNPVAGKVISFTLHHNMAGSMAQVRLKDMTGRNALASEIVAKPVNSISASLLAPGLYVMEIKIQNRTIVRKVIMK